MVVSKLKVLIPLDGSEKSMDSINWLKKFHSSEDSEVTLINIIERSYAKNMALAGSMSSPEAGYFEDAEYLSNQVLDKAEKNLEGYKINKLSAWGHSSDEILKEAKEGNYDMVVMTKSSVKGISRLVGSTTTKVIRDSEVAVIVVPE